MRTAQNLGTAIHLMPGLSTPLSIQQHVPAMCPDKAHGPALKELTIHGTDRQGASQQIHEGGDFREWPELWESGLPQAGRESSGQRWLLGGNEKVQGDDVYKGLGVSLACTRSWWEPVWLENVWGEGWEMKLEGVPLNRTVKAELRGSVLSP